MKTIKYLTIIFALILGVSSCELYDNVDAKNPTEVPSETLFTSAQYELVDQVDWTYVNQNISNLIVQYWQETTYFTESRYNFLDRNIPDFAQRNYYRDILIDFKEAKMLLSELELLGDADKIRNNKVAIIDIMEVYAWHNIVDTWGDMPYTEALDGVNNSLPVYDDAATIYTDILNRLSADITALDASVGSFGSADIIYEGDVAAWKKFAASLKLRMGMRLADVSPTASQTAVGEAVASGVFTSSDDNGDVVYPGVSPYTGRIYYDEIIRGRKDFIPTNTIVDKMNGLNDPRRSKFFSLYEGAYIGGEAGFDGALSYNNYSHWAPRFSDPTFESLLITYSEVEFLLAEAVERGYGVAGTAEEHYNKAIEASILYWGGTASEVADYLANPLVAYTTATGTYKQKIGEQKWIALYNQGNEGWAEWRRLDFPRLNVPSGFVYGDIPVRYPYPFDAVKLNETNYNAASTAIGGDDMRTKLFWDIF